MTKMPPTMGAVLPPATVERVEERIRNWVEWLHRSEGGGAKVCASIEHRYRGEWDDPESLDHHTRETVKVPDAVRVQLAFVDLERAHRAFITARYIKQRSDRYLCKRLQLTDLQLHAYRMRVLAELLKGLDQIERSEAKLIRRGKPIWAGNTGRT